MTKEEFTGWKTSRITQEVMSRLQEIQDYHRDLAAKATFHAETIDKVAMVNAYNAGICTGLGEMLELEWEDFTDG